MASLQRRTPREMPRKEREGMTPTARWRSRGQEPTTGIFTAAAGTSLPGKMHKVLGRSAPKDRGWMFVARMVSGLLGTPDVGCVVCDDIQ